MPKIEAGAQAGFFLLDGLPYQVANYEPVYERNGTEKFGIKRVGSAAKEMDYIAAPVPVGDWLDDTDTPFADLATLATYLQNFFFRDVAGGSGGLTFSGEVNTFADLPDPVTNDGQYWVVNQTTKTGVWPFRTTNSKGAYKAVSGAWDFRGADVAAFLVDDTLKFVDDVSGNALGFTLDALTSDRMVTFPDKDIRVINKTDLGWVQFQDGTYTDVSPLAIASGTRTLLPNDAANVLDLVNVNGGASWWNSGTSTFEPDNSGDTYDFRLQFTVDSAVNNRNLQIELDIGGSQGVIWDKTIRLARGAGVNTRVTETMQIYTLVTFVANGGQIFITCDGDIDLFDIVFVIERKFRNE